MVQPELEIVVAEMDIAGETPGASGVAATEVSNIAKQACVNGVIKEFMRFGFLLYSTSIHNKIDVMNALENIIYIQMTVYSAHDMMRGM